VASEAMSELCKKRFCCGVPLCYGREIE